MNTKYMFIVAAMAVMLIGATALQLMMHSPQRRQNITRQPVRPMRVEMDSCQRMWDVKNTASQIQGDENVVVTAADQAFP